jgi:signal transduction histidine kinase
MNDTIDGLITLARHPGASTGQCDPTAVVEERAAHWRPLFIADHRALSLRVEAGVPPVAAARFAIVTVLDVLLENAQRHGSGDTELVLRTSRGIVAIDVIDQGPYAGPPDPFADHASSDGGSGLGLGLARRTTADFGGRLLLAETTPHTRFGLLLPTG